ncbi:hypothetical protein BO86DRAFT_367002 [Aspergillus japonicus CBS 114.51]|uniref:RING-type domain-containing protein n=1 Tax=Aspergillus japonicus CBS 114.51 TaxID=1448312 RepID=A0A8T8WTV5_ASPJA|nr:hypothetical protein BO86DRAFT_367002 [Aspergillus japonicus CBS 114.51]RAH79275.1 hypothetical protein BO86DRAFT_367002 [Aspergillus japonicus CBS 114.51]
MSTYEVEHNTTDPSSTTPTTTTTGTTTSTHPRRPDLSTFFATLSEITPDESSSTHRPHAVPVPRDISAAFYTLAEALNVMRRDGGGGGGGGATIAAAAAGGIPSFGPEDTDTNGNGNELLTEMIGSLLQSAERPPKEVEGVSEEFCDVLDRVPKASLNSSQVCPICNNSFLEDQYPLVVRLPCHPTHLFDLECVRPWLRLRGTCPLDRTDFAKQEREKAEARRKPAVDDEEEEWDGMYG